MNINVVENDESFLKLFAERKFSSLTKKEKEELNQRVKKDICEIINAYFSAYEKNWFSMNVRIGKNLHYFRAFCKKVISQIPQLFSIKIPQTRFIDSYLIVKNKLICFTEHIYRYNILSYSQANIFLGILVSHFLVRDNYGNAKLEYSLFPYIPEDNFLIYKMYNNFFIELVKPNPPKFSSFNLSFIIKTINFFLYNGFITFKDFMETGRLIQDLIGLGKEII